MSETLCLGLANVAYLAVAFGLPPFLIRVFTRGLGWRRRVPCLLLAIVLGWAANYLIFRYVLIPLNEARFIAAVMDGPEERIPSDLGSSSDGCLGLVAPIVSVVLAGTLTKWFSSLGGQRAERP